MEKPTRKPQNPKFSSGPCNKRPGWSLQALEGALVGRSHRAKPCKAKLNEVIGTHREVLGIPADYRIGIVPASDTGAVEMAMWSMLGQRGVDVFAWENFSRDWLIDAVDHLKLEDTRIFEAPYGELPDLTQAVPDRDIVFPWNGTTSGVVVPDASWIADDREGVTICDATSAIFAYDMPWDKLDVTTWSWQKVLGGEAAHGMIVLSPRVVERLETYEAPRPLPKIFRMTKKGKLNEGIFEGETINTPSMIAVEDCLDALSWIKNIGGLKESIARAQRNFNAVEKWVNETLWIDFLAQEPTMRSRTSVCLKVTDPGFRNLSDDDQAAFVNDMVKLVEAEEAGFDFKAYRTAPPGLRIWCGSTVETSDVEALLPWLDWAFESTKARKLAEAA